MVKRILVRDTSVALSFAKSTNNKRSTTMRAGLGLGQKCSKANSNVNL